MINYYIENSESVKPKESELQMVKRLRKATGLGMMDCKKALIECNGEFNKAVTYLIERKNFWGRGW